MNKNSIDKQLKKIKKWRKNHPVLFKLKFIYYKISDFILGIPLNIESFIQRGKRGFSDRDTWCLYSYLSDVIYNSIKHLKKNINGHPSDLTEGRWVDILNNIIYTFFIAKKLGSSVFIIKDKKERKKWEKVFKDCNKKYNANDRCLTDKEIRKYMKGWKLFIKYFEHLWD